MNNMAKFKYPEISDTQMAEIVATTKSPNRIQTQSYWAELYGMPDTALYSRIHKYRSRVSGVDTPLNRGDNELLDSSTPIVHTLLQAFHAARKASN